MVKRQPYEVFIPQCMLGSGQIGLNQIFPVSAYLT